MLSHLIKRLASTPLRDLQRDLTKEYPLSEDLAGDLMDTFEDTLRTYIEKALRKFESQHKYRFVSRDKETLMETDTYYQHEPEEVTVTYEYSWPTKVILKADLKIRISKLIQRVAVEVAKDYNVDPDALTRTALKHLTKGLRTILEDAAPETPVGNPLQVAALGHAEEGVDVEIQIDEDENLNEELSYLMLIDDEPIREITSKQGSIQVNYLFGYSGRIIWD